MVHNIQAQNIKITKIMNKNKLHNTKKKPTNMKALCFEISNHQK